ncbi:MAG TPA: glycoside hydrolase family 15 [Phycisphaerales bacterium]|nr:glycoside hydrolase family 15 [Phycisphaerales bacterium]
MARDIPIGNGSLLVAFDRSYRIRDLYFPHVGKFNHTLGHVQRFGVWADGQFAWVDDASWTRSLRYRPDTLVTDVLLMNPALGVELRCQDAVDFHEPALIRKCVVRDLQGRERDVRLFYHYDLSIEETPVGDTTNYDPATAGLVLYKGDSFFMVNGCDERKCGIDHWATGQKRLGAAEGTWRDAEDGTLGRNAISQGSVDATIGFNLRVPAGGDSHVTTWLACGATYDGVSRLSRQIFERTPERYLARTEAYWRLWARRVSGEAQGLPQAVSDLFTRSQLIMRTQIDNGGAIIAANDSDITHFSGDHYSYCWPRDGALVAASLVRADQSELSRAFFRYAARVVNKNGYFLHKYTPSERLASSWHPWAIDGEAVLPIQQDETALVLWALRKHFESFHDVEFLKPLYNPLIIRPAEWMLAYRDKNGLPRPSWDLWEERRGIHTFTVASVIGALRAAQRFAQDLGDADHTRRYQQGADEMAAALRRHLWSEKDRRFARMAKVNPDGSYTLDMTCDSANFALFAFGALAPDDPMVEADLGAAFERLWVKTPIGGVARYENDYYHQVDKDDTARVPGNPWIICTLWKAQWLIAKAKKLADLREPLEILQWAASRALGSGVLAEQLDPHSGAPLSVSPLTWSHATVVMVVMDYIEKDASLRRAGAGKDFNEAPVFV